MSSQPIDAAQSCPVCESRHVNHVLTVDQAPAACNVLSDTPGQARAISRARIDLTFCADCGHLFNRSFDPSRIDYTGAYENALHHSPRFRAYAAELASRIVCHYGIRRARVVEIGCGDGHFLRQVCTAGDNAGVGFDPSVSAEAVRQALADGVELIRDFYGPHHRTRRGDCILCRHVIEHIDRPVEFIRATLAGAAADHHSVIYCEAPNALYTLEQGGVWDILYEHVSYFTPASLRAAFVRAGLDCHAAYEAFGRMYVCIEAARTPNAARFFAPGSTLPAIAENATRLAATYRQKTAWWRERLESIRHSGKTVVVWGAGTKGVMFCNAMPPGDIEAVVDSNPRKEGRFIAGTGQPIIAPASLAELNPAYVVVMNPLYEHEISETLRCLGSKASILVDSPDTI